MPEFTDNPLQWIVLMSTFLLVLVLWIGGVVFWSARRSKKQRQIEERLGLQSRTRLDAQGRTLRLWHEGEEVTTAVPENPELPSLGYRLRRFYRDTGLTVPLVTVVLGLVGIGCLLFVLVLTLSGSILAGLLSALAAAFAFYLYAKSRVNRTTTRFDQQFMDALQLAARSLRAGHPLTGAFQLIAEEIPDPVGEHFGEIVQRQSLGVSLEESLRRVAAQTPSDDMRLFSTAVAIQLRSGGNLADMMDRLASIVRDRVRLARRVRILTAQTQFSKWILLSLPLLMFLLLNLLNPMYMRPLYTTSTGQVMLLIAGTGLLLGAWVMNRMAQVHY